MYTNSRAYLLDHRMVIIEIINMKPMEALWYKEYRKLTTAAITEFQKNFNNQPILDATNLEDAIHQLNDQMLRNLNQVAPLKRRRSLKKTPKSWFNKDLLDQRKIKNREWRWFKYGQQHQWTAFKRERNWYNKMMKFYKRHNIFKKIKDNHNNPSNSIK